MTEQRGLKWWVENHTPQELFDMAVAHVRKQGRPSVHDGTCVYRGEDGLKCAVGIFLSDEEAADFDEDGLIVTADEACNMLGINSRGVAALLSDIQNAHDFPTLELGPFLPAFERDAMKVAEKHHLTYTPPEQP